jgi:hypothetical protein
MYINQVLVAPAIRPAVTMRARRFRVIGIHPPLSVSPGMLIRWRRSVPLSGG